MAQRYNIRMSTKQLVAVEGYQVKGHQYEPEVGLIVHRSCLDSKTWVVSELKSGAEFVHADTRKEAIEKINRMTLDKDVVTYEIEKLVKRFGAAN